MVEPGKSFSQLCREIYREKIAFFPVQSPVSVQEHKKNDFFVLPLFKYH
jgi:hypothetical protein